MGTVAARSVTLPSQTPACRGLVTLRFAGSGQARSRLSRGLGWVGLGWGGVWHRRPLSLIELMLFLRAVSAPPQKLFGREMHVQRHSHRPQGTGAGNHAQS